MGFVRDRLAGFLLDPPEFCGRVLCALLFSFPPVLSWGIRARDDGMRGDGSCVYKYSWQMDGWTDVLCIR